MPSLGLFVYSTLECDRRRRRPVNSQSLEEVGRFKNLSSATERKVYLDSKAIDVVIGSIHLSL